MKYAKTAIFYDHNTPLELKDLPVPELKPGEILIRNEYTTLCRSDLNTFCGRRIEKSPTILGHEIVGRIESFGPDTPTFDLIGAPLTIGDRVSWAIFAGNPNSAMAQKGMPQKSEDLYKYGHEKLTEGNVLHGGLSQYTLLKPHTPVRKVSEEVPFQVVALINCTVATIAGALRLAGNLEGKNVLVVGAGMLGTMACAMAKTAGAKMVVACDINAERLKKARYYGADLGVLVNEYLENEIARHFGCVNPFDVTIEVSGSKDAMEQTMNLMAIGGIVIWLGATFPQPGVSINAEQIVRRILTIKGLHNYNLQDFNSAVDFIEQHHQDFPFLDMIHDQFGLEEVQEAFNFALEHNPFRVGVRM